MEAAPTGQNPQQTQSNLPDRRLARKVGADYNKLVQAMRRLERNPNPKLLPAELMQHYNKYVGASINAAQVAARSGGARYFAESSHEDPPMMLILKRRGIRIFPDGQRVALYYNDKLGLSFSIPYVAGKFQQDAVGVYEETEVNE